MTEIKGEPKVLVVGRTNDVRPRYWCAVQCRDVPYHGSIHMDCDPEEERSKAVGLDLGLSHIAYLSNGICYDNDHEYQKKKDDFEKLHREYTKHRCDRDADRHLAKLQHAYTKLTNHRKNTLHKISHDIAENHETIVMEDLSVKQLRSISLSRRMMNSYNDASLGGLMRLICYKAVDASHKVRFVDPRGTSQICSGCGCIVKKTLDVREHRCPHCGLRMDRDLNAAINILKRGRPATLAPKAESSTARASKPNRDTPTRMYSHSIKKDAVNKRRHCKRSGRAVDEANDPKKSEASTPSKLRRKKACPSYRGSNARIVFISG